MDPAEIEDNFHCIKEWGIRMLYASNHQLKHLGLINSIDHIPFLSLKFLSLSENNTESTEFIRKIMVPSLEQLLISKQLLSRADDNRIVHLKEIRKARWHSLS